MRKFLCFMLATVMAGTLIPVSINEVSAASMPSSYNKLTDEEKSAFNKLYKQSSDSTLQSVNVNYSTSLSGQKDISSYHWTAWKKVAKGASITKATNSGKGVGSGSYTGFTQKKIDSWKTDEKYIKAIKELNKGKFPSDGNYSFPTETTSSKLDWWVDKVGFYDIMSDPKYSKITLNGYRTFNWTEKVRKEEIKKKVKSLQYKKGEQNGESHAGGDTLGFGEYSTAGTLQMWETIKIKLRADFDIILVDSEAKRFEKQIKNSYESHYQNTSVYQMHGTETFMDKGGSSTVQISISGQTSDGVTPDLVVIQVTKKTKSYTYETKSHTSKQQIASTVVARNAYASEIVKYNNFYLVPKSSVSSKAIKTRSTGFWYNIKPYYHGSSQATKDEGNYNWTYSNQVTKGKTGTNVFIMLPVSYKLFTDFADSHLTAPGLANPPLDGNSNNNGNNGGNNNNSDGGSNNNHNGGDNNNSGGGNNGNNGNGGNNNGNNNGNNGNNGHTSIGDKNNSPMINVELDAKGEGGTIGTVRVPIRVHLVDIDKERKK